VSLDQLQDDWTRLGKEDPLWAVYVAPGTKGGKWDVDAFFALGREEVDGVFAEFQRLGLTPGRRRALDFGCGVGRLSQALAEHVDEVVGVDISPTMLEKAREIVDAPACDFRLATGPELDVVEPASADLVYTCRVLQHMPTELAHRYVRAFYRIVRPGGYVVFQMPTAPARNAAGLALRALPAPLARRLRRGMEMHGTPEAGVRALVAECGAEMLAADEDTSAGPRWGSRLYVTRAAPA
jgi:SAM-dependent methyltransferase